MQANAFKVARGMGLGLRRTGPARLAVAVAVGEWEMKSTANGREVGMGGAFFRAKKNVAVDDAAATAV
jgi:hypothetical protein